MGRPRRQEPRRAQLVAATRTVLARNGMVGLRVRDIAAEAGMSPASVLYYYPESAQLAVIALTQAISDLGTERAAVAASMSDPVRRVRALIELDLSDSMTGLWRAVAEIPAQSTSHPELKVVFEQLVEDQTQALNAALRDAVEAGQIAPTQALGDIASAVVTMIHGIRATQAVESSQVDALKVADLLMGIGQGSMPPVVSVTGRDVPVSGASITREPVTT